MTLFVPRAAFQNPRMGPDTAWAVGYLGLDGINAMDRIVMVTSKVPNRTRFLITSGAPLIGGCLGPWVKSSFKLIRPHRAHLLPAAYDQLGF